MFKTKYRIVTDSFLGYEAQFKPWWFPVWQQCFSVNTSHTIERAQKVCDRHANGLVVVEEYDPHS